MAEPTPRKDALKPVRCVNVGAIRLQLNVLSVIYSELDVQDLVLALMFAGLFETAALAVAFQITPSLSEWQLRYKNSVTLESLMQDCLFYLPRPVGRALSVLVRFCSWRVFSLPHLHVSAEGPARRVKSEASYLYRYRLFRALPPAERPGSVP